MKRTILQLFILLMMTVTASAQQPRKVTRTWFQNPDIQIETPAFSRSYGFTTYKEMMRYLRQEVAANPQYVSMETVGSTQKGRDITLVTVSNGRPSANKLRILYTGCVHGNEHAGTEGLLWLIHQLTAQQELQQLLDDIDLYIMPMVNADGSEADRRHTNNGTDPNRDQTRLSTPEVQAMHNVASRVSPHLYIDFHEYKPLRTSYEELSDRLISNPNDYMYLYSSNPNVYPGIGMLIEQQYIPRAEQMARQWGLQTSLYYTTKSDVEAGVVMNVGGQAARSSCNIMALRGSISMLMEVRGIGLGRTSYLRRVNTVYQLACSYAQTTKECAADVRRVTEAAASQTADIVTRYEQPTEKGHPFEFIDLLRNQKTTIAVDARPAKGIVVKQAVPRPRAYYIDATATTAIDLIKKFGIRYEVLDKPLVTTLQAYTVTDTRRQRAEVLGMHPVSVSVKADATSVSLPAGSLRIPMEQPLSTLAAILLEPECSNGFVNFHVVEPRIGQVLPFYRSTESAK
ncbi:MAG: peptidase [Prevotella sp.]|nr:peptidase [Prevotella sp.]